MEQLKVSKSQPKLDRHVTLAMEDLGIAF